MAFESNTYSGICKYKDIDFTFIFSGEELRLVGERLPYSPPFYGA